MTGSYDIVVSNSRLQYKFTINRNITIIRGNSATGKTTLINMINESKKSTDISLISKVPCIVIPDTEMWDLLIQNTHNSILFFDEDCEFVGTHDFARIVKKSDCYFVIVTRKKLSNLPYSINEVYELIESSHYGVTGPVTNKLVKMYDSLEKFYDAPTIIVEDSNSGYEFFKGVFDEKNILVANGKNNIINIVKTITTDLIVVADGAAFGDCINELIQLNNVSKNIYMFLPESFEWLILKSKLFYNKVKNELCNTSKYVDSNIFMSWEQYFTYLLCEMTKDTNRHYDKSSLNPYYLTPYAVKEIMEVISICPISESMNLFC